MLAQKLFPKCVTLLTYSCVLLQRPPTVIALLDRLDPKQHSVPSTLTLLRGRWQFRASQIKTS